MSDKKATWRDRAEMIAFRTAIAVSLSMPYELRVRFMGALCSSVIAPLIGWRRRIRANLGRVFPGMSKPDIERLVRAVPNNAGRTLIENFSTEDLLQRAKGTSITGPGLQILERARADGRAVVLATGHFGNYEAARAALIARGFKIGGLYRPMKNPLVNEVYRKTMEAFGGPVVPQGRRGTATFVRVLKEGGMMVLLYDLFVHGAPQIPFLGHATRTATSAAELALRQDALLIPFFAVRQQDGFSFEVHIENPIPPSTPNAMTEALNSRLETQVRRHPEQWFWVHRRWKEV